MSKTYIFIRNSCIGSWLVSWNSLWPSCQPSGWMLMATITKYDVSCLSYIRVFCSYILAAKATAAPSITRAIVFLWALLLKRLYHATRHFLCPGLMTKEASTRSIWSLNINFFSNKHIGMSCFMNQWTSDLSTAQHENFAYSIWLVYRDQVAILNANGVRIEPEYIPLGALIGFLRKLILINAFVSTQKTPRVVFFRNLKTFD